MMNRLAKQLLYFQRFVKRGDGDLAVAYLDYSLERGRKAKVASILDELGTNEDGVNKVKAYLAHLKNSGKEQLVDQYIQYLEGQGKNQLAEIYRQAPVSSEVISKTKPSSSSSDFYVNTAMEGLEKLGSTNPEIQTILDNIRKNGDGSDEYFVVRGEGLYLCWEDERG